MNTFFYTQIEENSLNKEILTQVKNYCHVNKKQIYIINKPLGEKKYYYEYEDNSIVILSPNFKIIIINLLNNNDESFENYIEDFLEDLGSLSDKFSYKGYIGRPRKWRSEMITVINGYDTESFDLDSLMNENKIEDAYLKRKSELLISLLTGSINDIDSIKDEVPQTILDKIKRKIVLFDGDQTRFIYQQMSQKRINIQGLSNEVLKWSVKDVM